MRKFLAKYHRYITLVLVIIILLQNSISIPWINVWYSIIEYLKGLPELIQGAIVSTVVYVLARSLKQLLDYMHKYIIHHLKYKKYKKYFYEFIDLCLTLEKKEPIKIALLGNCTLDDFTLTFQDITNTEIINNNHTYTHPQLISIVFYAMDVNHCLSPQEKNLLVSFIKHSYPKIFIAISVTSCCSVQLAKKEGRITCIVNQWKGDSYYQGTQALFKFSSINERLTDKFYDDYIRNFVKENH